jgi:HEAT repeat protein
MHIRCSRLLIVLCSLAVDAAAANPPSQEEVARRADLVQRLKQSLAADDTSVDKVGLVMQTMLAEEDADGRRMVLDAAIQGKGLDFDRLLIKVLSDDPDAGIRSRAATALGGLGSEKCFGVLAKAAASDKTTTIEMGCIVGKSSARRDATFAIAALVARFPKLAEKAAAELRGLKTGEDPKDSQSLADARLQSLYQVTREESLLEPFYGRLRSKEASERIRGVVAFQYLGLKSAPQEVIAAMSDDNTEVRSWAALVIGSIADPKTIPVLIAAAEDSQTELGIRCNALHSLGRMRAAAATTTLHKLLQDADPAIQSQAAIALYRITGEKVPQFPEGYNAE